ncbi:MAG TPA: FAD-dependent monooxygenase, partial [Coxiellaceae bacterium]|nr:FAD-dependent monooxygenase [Coxiellaceae bacterium]
MKTEFDYDLIIVGAGLVGSSLALALKDTALKILCLDRKPLSLQKELTQDSRPISLSYTSVQILKKLGAWSALENLATPIQKVHVSTEGGFGRLEFKAIDTDLPYLGMVVPFAHLEQAVLQAAFQNVHLAYSEISEIKALNCSDRLAQITVMKAGIEQQLTAQLVVAADGTHSRVRELLEIETQQDESQEIAFSARIHLQKPHSGVAYERFSSEGTFALLPNWDANIVNLVWTMPASVWERWRLQSGFEVLAKVQKVFGYRLGKMLHLEPLADYPLVS